MSAAVETVGFIGLGRMGAPMARHLVARGWPVRGYDLRPEAVAAFAAAGGQAAGSPAEAAGGAGIVFTMLPTAAHVEQVLDAVLGTLREGALVVDMSTIEPVATDRLAARCAARGLAFADAPVGRLASHADRGECLFMVGAQAADFARVRPLLEAMGTTIHHCGEVGAGIRTKLVNNYLAVVSCQLNAEALTLSQAFGLDLEKTLEVLGGTTATNGQLRMNWPSKSLAGDLTPGFTLDLADKDLSLIIAAGHAARVPLPVAAAAREAMAMARAGGFGGRDFSCLADALCAQVGIRPPRLAPPGKAG